MAIGSLRALFRGANASSAESESTIRAALTTGLRKGGTATLVSGQTSIAVTHGLGFTPSAADIMVTPIETLASASFFFVDTLTSTQFTINVDANPTQDVDFAWKADRTE